MIIQPMDKNDLTWQIPRIGAETEVVIYESVEGLLIGNGEFIDRLYPGTHIVNDTKKIGGIINRKKVAIYSDCKIIAVSKQEFGLSGGFCIDYYDPNTKFTAKLQGNINTRVRISDSKKFYDSQHITTVASVQRLLRDGLEHKAISLLVDPKTNIRLYPTDESINNAISDYLRQYGLRVVSASITINDDGMSLIKSKQNEVVIDNMAVDRMRVEVERAKVEVEIARQEAERAKCYADGMAETARGVRSFDDKGNNNDSGSDNDNNDKGIKSNQKPKLKLKKPNDKE